MIAADLRGLARPLAALRPDPGNARRHDEANLRAIVASLKAHGQVKPVVVRGDTVIAGNGTLEAARRLGWDELACVQFTGTAEQARAYAVADNRAGELATWDDAALAAALGSCAEDGLLDATGYDQGGLDALLAALDGGKDQGKAEPSAGETDRQTAGSANDGAASEVGGIYELGRHLLVCGDARDADLVGRALPACPDIVWTDPPYGVDYSFSAALRPWVKDGSAGKKLRQARHAIANDADDPTALIVAALERARAARAAFVCCNWRSLGTMQGVFELLGWPEKACLVWSKAKPHQNLDLYAKAHEFLLYTGPFGGESTQCSDVWELPRDFQTAHPTPKPVALVEHALRTVRTALADVTQPVVFDPFGGAGATILGAEAAGCRAVVVELIPEHVTTARRRFGDYARSKNVSPGSGAL